MTLHLPPDLEKIIDERVKTGEFASPEDVIRAGLILLQRDREHDAADDFAPGELDRMLEEADDEDSMTLDEAIARRRAERANRRVAP